MAWCNGASENGTHTSRSNRRTSPSLFSHQAKPMQNLDKIEKIFGMIGSDSDGECLNAVALIKRNLKAQGKNWNDFSKHLFGAAPRVKESSREDMRNRWRDMHEDARKSAREDRNREYQRTHKPEDGWPNDTNETWKHKNKEQEKPHANNGKYSYGDPYPGYSEHKKMALELVNVIITKNSTMTQWETSFIQDIYNKNICMARSLSSKQESILQRIYEQYIKS